MGYQPERHRRLRWFVSGGAALCVLMVLGCVSSGPNDLRVTRYTPDVSAGRPVGLPVEAPQVDVKGGDEAPPTVPELVAPVQPAVVAVPEAPVEVVQPPQASEGSPVGAPGEGRKLTKGQRVSINLMGIPKPLGVDDEIDGRGCVNMEYIGPVKLEGLTTSQAESLIERTYIEREIYREVTAIVVAQEDEYYVDGQVQRPGGFLLRGEMTLRMAVSAAGGYTEWAKPSRIRIKRGDQVLWFNGERIDKGLDPDPPIQDSDVITVEKRGWL